MNVTIECDEMEKYRIVKKLSESSSSRVSLVELTTSSRQLFVIKEINFHARVSLLDRNQILNESNLLASLSHPNILKFIETFVTENGTICIVTEYCEGGDLVESSRNNLEFDDIKTIIIQLLLALKYLHDKNILHRDLKLKNIFISSKSGGIVRIKIGDFGIARSLGCNQLATTMVGTPFYLSPELCAKQPYDKSIDIWSLGCVFYELFSRGRQPFNAKTLEDLIGKIQVEPVDYSVLKVDFRVQEMIRKMLTKNPKERLTIDELLSLPVIQEYIQEFVLKINNSQKIPHRNFESFSPSSTIKSFSSAAVNESELLTTIRQFIKIENDPLEKEFNSQINQAKKTIPTILLTSPQTRDRLKREANRVQERLINFLILPSRILHFLDLVVKENFDELKEHFVELGDENILKEIICSGLIGDALVMLEIQKNNMNK